jgi:cobalt/nickel transport protein
LNVKALCVLAAITVAIAGVVSYFASSSPDALEHSLATYREGGKTESAKAADVRAAATGGSTESGGYEAPLQDYSVPGVENTFLSGGMAGIAGALVTFAVIILVAAALKSAGKRKSENKTNG